MKTTEHRVGIEIRHQDRRRRPSIRRLSIRRSAHFRLRVDDLQVLHAVYAGRVQRDSLYGDLAPWMWAGRPVSWQITWLVVRGMIWLDLLGVASPQLTARGLRVLNGADCPGGSPGSGRDGD